MIDFFFQYLPGVKYADEDNLKIKWRKHGNQGNWLWKVIFMPTLPLLVLNRRVNDFYFSV